MIYCCPVARHVTPQVGIDSTIANSRVNTNPRIRPLFKNSFPLLPPFFWVECSSPQLHPLSNTAWTYNTPGGPPFLSRHGTGIKCVFPSSFPLAAIMIATLLSLIHRDKWGSTSRRSSRGWPHPFLCPILIHCPSPSLPTTTAHYLHVPLLLSVMQMSLQRKFNLNYKS